MARSSKERAARRRAQSAAARATAKPPRRRFSGMTLAHWIGQIALAAIGVGIVITDGLGWVLAWNVLGTLYAVTAIVALARLSRRPTDGDDLDDDTSRFLVSANGVMTAVLTVVPALIGVTAALMVILDGKDADHGVLVKIVGVWAMLLAWGFLHWGFAQVYMLHERRHSPERSFEFPRTPRPGLVDFVYFSFTLGTTFAASDVSVLTTRARWVVTVHSVLSFLLNALIIALSFNTIMSAATG